MIVSILFVYISELKKKDAADSQPLGSVELINVTTCCYYWFPFRSPHHNYCLTYPLVASCLKLTVNSLVLGLFPVLL